MGLTRWPDEPNREPPQFGSSCGSRATDDHVSPMPDRDEAQEAAVQTAKDALRRAVERGQSAFKDWVNAASRVNDIGWLLANAIGGSDAEVARLLQARDAAQAEADRLRAAYEAARREVDTLARQQTADPA